MSPNRLAHATAPNESGWSFHTLLAFFTAALPGWLRRRGLHRADIEDAVQDALVEACENPDELLVETDDSRRQMLRIADRVAKRSESAGKRNVMPRDTRTSIMSIRWARRMKWMKCGSKCGRSFWLLGAVVLLTGVSLNQVTPVAEARRIGSVEWPAVEISAPAKIEQLEQSVPLSTSSVQFAPRKIVQPVKKPSQVLDRKTLAALRGTGTPEGAPEGSHFASYDLAGHS